MEKKFLRNYSDVLSRLAFSLDGTGELVSLGEIDHLTSSHPIQKMVLGAGNSKKVLISAGIHGDEPAGVETLRSYLERKEYSQFLQNWEITLIPCINPFGYEYGTRENHDGVDLNRQFKSLSPPKEVALVQSVFQSPYDLTLELHEDEDSSGYYTYHSGASEPRMEFVQRILKEVEKVMPLNLDAEIDGSPANGGIIDRIPDHETMDWWPMALYSLSKKTGTCLTLETALKFPMEVRTEAHLSAIRAALTFFPD